MKYESKRIRSSEESPVGFEDYEVVKSWVPGLFTIVRPKSLGITKAIIPSNCDYIGEHAFDGCRNLRIVEFARGSRVHAKEYSFANTPNLKRIVSDSLVGVFEGAFENSGIEEFVAPVSHVDSDCFKNCKKLRRIELTVSGIVTIGTEAIVNCPNLETLESSSQVRFKSNAIVNCPNLILDSPGAVNGWDYDAELRNMKDSRTGTKEGSGRLTRKAWDLLPEADDIENITVLNKTPDIGVSVGDYLVIDSDSEMLNDDNAVEIKKIHETSLVEIEFDFGEEEYLGIIATVDVYRLGGNDDELIERGVKLFLLQTQDSGGQSAGTYAIARWR